MATTITCDFGVVDDLHNEAVLATARVSRGKRDDKDKSLYHTIAVSDTCDAHLGHAVAKAWMMYHREPLFTDIKVTVIKQREVTS